MCEPDERVATYACMSVCIHAHMQADASTRMYAHASIHTNTSTRTSPPHTHIHTPTHTSHAHTGIKTTLACMCTTTTQLVSAQFATVIAAITAATAFVPASAHTGINNSFTRTLPPFLSTHLHTPLCVCTHHLHQHCLTRSHTASSRSRWLCRMRGE